MPKRVNRIDQVLPASEEEIARHDANFNAPLQTFRKVYWTNPVSGVREMRHVHLALLVDTLIDITEVEGQHDKNIRVYNSLTGVEVRGR